MKISMDVDNKSLAWIEAYSMAITGAAGQNDRERPVMRDVHERACWLADQAVDALEERISRWKADKSTARG